MTTPGRRGAAAEPAQRQRGFIVLGTLLIGALGLLALAGLLVALTAAWYWRDLPALDKATDYRPHQHLQVFTADGVEIAQFGTERRLFVPIAQTPKLLRDAVLATEDAQFYSHPGISIKGLARAMLANLRGGTPQGASTITQQVARTFFLSTRRTPERKIKEALLALQLERRLGKDQILELYMNQIYLGQRAYGFGSAAQEYFGKPLATLSLAETAMLAGLPQNPIHANPVAAPERARKRQQWVLQRMAHTGAISAADVAAASAEQLLLRRASVVEVHAEHAAEMARRVVVERLGDKAYTDGIRVTISLRAADQRAAHAALRRALLAHERKQPWRGPEDEEALPGNEERAERAAALALQEQRDDDELRVAIVMAASPRELVVKLASGERATLRGDSLKWVQAALAPRAPDALAIRRGSIVRVLARKAGNATEWTLVQWPQADAAFVALDAVTGRIRALVGGFGFNQRQFNHVTAAQRQPGSSFKPFLYSAAFESGVMPETLVDDAPLASPEGGAPGWDPRNSDGKFDGEISVREGLVRSKNLVSIRLLQHVGVGPVRNWISRFGFDMDKQPANLTLALGTGSVTPLQLAQAYAVLANGGHSVTALLIERIASAQGEVLYQAPAPAPLDDSRRVLPARNVFLVNSLLADVARRGTAARAQAALKRPDVYGKTGTTNDAVDAWFGGHAAGIVAVAWMGYDEPRSLGEGESGGGLALPIWIDAMTAMLRGVPVQPLVPPDGVVRGDSDWRYAELDDGAVLARVGPPPEPPTPVLPPLPALPPPLPPLPVAPLVPSDRSAAPQPR